MGYVYIGIGIMGLAVLLFTIGIVFRNTAVKKVKKQLEEEYL